MSPPILKKRSKNLRVVTSLIDFKGEADIIITNRMHADLDDVSTKVFTRDSYGRD